MPGHLTELGLETRGLFWLVLDALLVLGAACALRARLGRAGEGAARAALSVSTLGLAVVTASGLGLGLLGRFSPGALLVVHALLIAALPLLLVPRSWMAGAKQLGGTVPAWAREVQAGLGRVLGPAAPWSERAPALAAIAVLLVAAFSAALTPIANGDTLAYRLPRIAMWLQEGRVGHLAAFELYDDRSNYVAFGVDLVMAWTVGFFTRGFPLAKLVQVAGGLLASAATWSLARHAGFARPASLAAVVLLLGLPNLSAQLVSTQTDLFTTGCLAAALVFFLDAARSGRRSDWLLAGLAFGLALGAKGTVFYWMPGLAVVAVVALWPRRRSAGEMVRGAAVATAAAALLGSTPYLLNLRSYGSPFSSPGAARIVHSTPSSSRAHFAAFNAAAYGWQTLEPSSNPPFVEGPVRQAFAALGDRLVAWAESVPPAPGVAERLASELPLFEAFPLYADWLSTGVLAVALAALGAVRSALSLGRGRAGHALLPALALSVLAFFLVFCSLQAWSPHKFRYFVLLGPALAVLALRGLLAPGAAPGRGVATLVAAVLGIQVLMAARVLLFSEGGLRAIPVPPPAVRAALAESRALLEALGREPLRLCLANEGGHLLRGPVAHHYVFASRWHVLAAGTAEAALAALGCDAMLLDPAGLESRLGRVRIFRPGPWPRVVAVQRLAAGEEPDALCMQTYGLHASGWSDRHAWVRYENWQPPNLRLRVQNPAPVERRVVLRTSRGRRAISVAPGGRATVDVATARADRLRVNVTPPYPLWERGPGGIRVSLPSSLDCGGLLVP